MKVRALRDEFYLDKHSFPLRDNLLKMIRDEAQFNYIKTDDLKDLLSDILSSIKPTYEQVTQDPMG